MNLSNNTILITGGSSGIGLAMARQFIRLGNRVIITGRDEKKLEQVRQQWPGVYTFAGDLTHDKDLSALVQYLRQEHSGLNILINNAAIQYNYSFLQEADLSRKISHEIETNLTAPVRLIALLLPLLQEKPEAAIVNVSSGLGLVPKRSAPVYCGTKAGLHIFTKALRYQLEASPVRVFEVIPPLVDTPMTAGRGKSKISPDELVREFLHHFSKNHYEINIGKTKLLRLIQRLWPAMADKILKDN